MTPEERYRRIDALLDRALELKGPARAAFLDEACGDDTRLRSDLDALLASHEHAGSFLTEPAIESAAKALGHDANHALVGKTLGPYPIQSLLGAGGMGDVYRAHDPRLGRDVAVKVLPSHLSDDAKALARFNREMRALASLSHPNILAIHDIGTDRGIAYGVMELVEGETLRQRLAAGPMAWRKAVRVAIEISDGLAAAHAKRIIHRDLKPENIVFDASDRTKILDFGLARVVSGAPDGIAAPGGTTVPGIVMGTIGYMSPEQIRGEEAGPASDLFALGCLLYEMVSGRPPFSSGTPSESLAAVLRDDPAPLADAAIDVPPALEALIRRCLEKRLTDRFQSASDLSFVLRTIGEDVRATGPATPSSNVFRLSSVMLVLGTALGVVIVAAGITLWRRPAPTSGGLVQLTLPLEDGLAVVPNLSPAGGSSVAISRDGQWIAFVVRRERRQFLALRRIDRSALTILPETEGAISPVFSPDARWIAYFTTTDLRKVPIGGGTPTVLGRMPPVTRGATWGDDDNIYFSPSFSEGLQRVPAAGGLITQVTNVDLQGGESNHLLPEAVPGARALLFTVWRGGDFSTAQIWAVSLNSNDRKLILDGATAPHYGSPGHLVFARGGGLFAVRFDPERLTTSGEAMPIIDAVWTDRLTGTAHYSVSTTGTLVYAAGSDTIERRRLVWVDRTGRTELLPAEPSFYADPRISPDGQKVAVEALNDIWIYDLREATLTRMTSRGVNQFPVWSPDGRQLALSSSHGKVLPTLFWTDVDAASRFEPISSGGRVQFPTSWLRTDGALAYAGLAPSEPSTDWDVWVMHPGKASPARAIIQTQFKEDQPMFEPNGRALAYVSDETGQLEVYVRAYPSLNRRVRVSTDGGTEPVWSRSGTELFYRSGRRYFSVPVSHAAEAIRIGRPSLMFEGNFVIGSLFPGYPSYDVSSDGRRFLAVMPATDAPQIDRLEVVLDWPREFTRRLTSGSGQ
jgi:serine/threonine-protein kinase